MKNNKFYKLIEKLFPLNRSLAGPANLKTLHELKKINKNLNNLYSNNKDLNNKNLNKNSNNKVLNKNNEDLSNKGTINN